MSGSWAHGRTAATDERIARSAAGHRGLTYARRTPPEQCRWRRGRRAVAGPIPWSARFSYGIGLLATDGWVTTPRRGGQPGHVGFTSKDKALVESFLSCFELTNHIRERDRDGHVHFETNTGKVAIFEWARTIGIDPRKSRTVASLSVPDELLPHVVRGHVDGDGSVTWSRRGPRGDQFQVRFHSASRPHLDWLRARSLPLTTTAGSLTVRTPIGGYGRVPMPMHTLAYGRRASERLLEVLYADPAAPRLERKWRAWMAYRSRQPRSGLP